VQPSRAAFVFFITTVMSIFVLKPQNTITGSLLGLMALCVLPSCDRVSERMEITQTRDISTYEAKPKLNAYPQ